MNKLTEVEEITFIGRYISGEAKRIFTDFSENTCIIKKSCGIGGTRAVLDATDKDIILVCPYKSIMFSKEKKKKLFLSSKQIFINADTTEGFADVSHFLSIRGKNENLIIVCTPDQIVSAKKKFPILFERLQNFNLFVDEWHCFTADSQYREVMGQFMELVYNQWRANFILSTATPNYNNFDLPLELSLRVLKVGRKYDCVKPIAIGDSYDDAFSFIEDELSQKRKVVVFTNISNFYRRDYGDVVVRNLISKSLRYKLIEYGINQDNILDPGFWEADLFILSSSFFTGMDIPIDCSVCIISDMNYDAHAISINMITQAYHRCRGVVFNGLIVNKVRNYSNNKPIEKFETEKEIEAAIKRHYMVQTKMFALQVWENNNASVENTNDIMTDEGYLNRAKLASPLLSKIELWQVSEWDVLYLQLKDYQFQPFRFQPSLAELKTGRRKRPTKCISHLLNFSAEELRQMYDDVRERIKYKNKGVFTWKTAFNLLTSYLIQHTAPEQILLMVEPGKKRLRPDRIYRALNSYLRMNYPSIEYTWSPTKSQLAQWKRHVVLDPRDVEHIYIKDWLMLYQVFLVDTDKKIFFDLTDYAIKATAGDEEIILRYVKNKEKREEMVQQEIQQRLKLQNILPDQVQHLKIKSIWKKAFLEFDRNGTYTSKYNHDIWSKKFREAIIFLLHHGQGIYSQRKNKYRQYGGITELPRCLRPLIPIKYVEIDISSANPQIIDRLIGSNLAMQVYKNICKKWGFSRKIAKTVFNRILNSWYLSKQDMGKFFVDIGYSPLEAKKLIELTSGTDKGEFFQLITAEEEQIINSYRSYLSNIPTMRLHDAVIIPFSEAKKVKLPSVLRGIRFEIGMYNNDERYDGPMTDNSDGDFANLYLRK